MVHRDVSLLQGDDDETRQMGRKTIDEFWNHEICFALFVHQLLGSLVAISLLEINLNSF